MEEKLKDKAVKGARWGVIENFSSLAATFIVGIILGRILSEQEFGIIAHLTFFIAISISFIDNGFSAALIKKIEPTKEDLQTTFSTNLLISILFYLILFALSKAIANFFDLEILSPLLRVLSIVLIINSISIIQRTLLVKAVDFKKLTICSLSSSIISGIVGIYMAVNDYGVWSLVGLQISKQLVNSLMLWIVGKWKFSLGFSLHSFRSLFSYGSRVLATGLLDTIFRNIYFPIIGKFFSIGTLGQYSRADQFSNVTSNNLSQIIQRVSFPILSKAQQDNERLKNAFRTILLVSVLVSSFVCLWLASVAKPLIFGLIGEKWDKVPTMLQIISLSGILLPLHYLNQNILQIKGKMNLFLKLELIKKGIIIISIFIGILIGFNALLWGGVIASIVVYIVFAYFSGKHLQYPINKQVKEILRPIIISSIGASICGLATWGIIYFSKTILDWYHPTFTNLLAVIIGSLCGATTIFYIYKFFPSKEFDELKNLLKFKQ